MFKRIALTFIQFVAFLTLLFLGGFWPFVRLYVLGTGNRLLSWAYQIPVWKITFSESHYVNANGYIYASVFFALILIVEALVRRYKPWMMLSVLAFVLALLVSLEQKFGSVTITS